MSEIESNEDNTRELVDRVVSIASLTFGAVSVVRTLRAAKNDEDGLQLTEALLRGATLAVSVALFIRGLREVRGADEVEGETAA